MDFLSQNIDILWMSRYYYKKNSELPIHSHLYHQIIYFLEGNGEVFLEEKWIPISCPSILVLQPNDQHGFTVKDGLKTIDVKFALRREKKGDPLDRIRGINSVSGSDKMVDLLEELLVIGASKNPLYRERCQLLLSFILLQLLSGEMSRDADKFDKHLDQTTLGSKSPLCQALVNYIEKNLEGKIDSTTIEASMGYTYRHISHHTSAELYMSPMQLVRFLRIQRAKELIANNFDLRTVAAKTGFQSIYHFSRIFKQQEGLPPGAWKDQQIRDICRDITIDPNFINKWSNSLHKGRRNDKNGTEPV